MSSLSKLTIKAVSRQSKLSPIEARRNKLLAGINEQMEVADAAMRGEQYAVTVPRWTINEAGEKVRVQRQKVVRSWFFAQDGGFYVQCKYGAKAISLSKDGNAVFVKQLAEVKPTLEMLRSATKNGELDEAVAALIKR
jgi:capsid portal protein